MGKSKIIPTQKKNVTDTTTGIDNVFVYTITLKTTRLNGFRASF